MQIHTDQHGRKLTLLRVVGKGGFGEVYEALVHTSTGLSRRVAVKLLRGDLADSDDALLRLNDEAQLLTHLRHPVVVGVEDLVKLEDRTALISEFIDGCDLSSAMPMPPRAALEVISKVAEALAAAWDQRGPDGSPLRIVHRDIKPGNIRLGPHGVVKLLDFGIARSETMVRAAKTGTGLMVGSVGYMAPERWLGEPDSHPGDVFALGCVLYAALAGEPLYKDMTPAAQVGASYTQERLNDFIESRLEDLPRGGARALSLLRDMLAHAPADRPTAAQVAERALTLAARSRGQSLLEWSSQLSASPSIRDDERVDSSWVEGPGGFRRIGSTTNETMERPVASEPPAKKVTPQRKPRRGLLIGLVSLGLIGVGALALISVAAAAIFATSGADLSEISWPGSEPSDPEHVTMPPTDSEAEEPEAAAHAEEPPDQAEPEPVPTPAEAEPTRIRQPQASTSPDASRRSSPATQDSNGSRGASASEIQAGPSLLTAPPSPTAPAAEPPSARATVTVDSAVPVRLRSSAGLAEPGAVPPGRYTVQASFAHGAWTDTLTVDLVEGQTVAVRCNQRFRRCAEVQ